MTFEELDLIGPLLDALHDEGYEEPTPIQAQAIPPLLEGRDLLGVAQTGTGKTAAFSLPVLQLLHESRVSGKRHIRALVVTPTRELAAQIHVSLENYGANVHPRSIVIFGGVSQKPQEKALRAGVDILVATPGRLLDLEGQGYIDLSQVEFFVLDEADRMLDMGFIHDMKKVMALLPRRRQNLLFSATMPQEIVKLSRSFLRDPVKVEVTPQATTVELIHQQVMFVEKADKPKLLTHLVQTLPDFERAIVFTRTKHGANRLVKHLDKQGVVAAAIHGNKSQGARERALGGFRAGKIPVLVATDVAARGIDVPEISHVFNYDLPNISESYVHRIGRTARAGREGVAIAFCDDSEGGYLRDIERLTGEPIEKVLDQPWHCRHAVPGPNHRPTTPPDKKQNQQRQQRGRGRKDRGRGRRDRRR